MRWTDHLSRDDQGRIVLNERRSARCRHCGSVHEYVSADGTAVLYVTPKECCAPRAADRRAQLARREANRGPH